MQADYEDQLKEISLFPRVNTTKCLFRPKTVALRARSERAGSEIRQICGPVEQRPLDGGRTSPSSTRTTPGTEVRRSPGKGSDFLHSAYENLKIIVCPSKNTGS